MNKQFSILCLLLTTVCFLLTACNSTSQTNQFRKYSHYKTKYNKYKTIKASESPNNETSAPVVTQTGTNELLWDHLRRQFRLQHYSYHPSVVKQIRWYQAHQNKLYEALNNSAPFLYLVSKEAEARNLPSELVLLPLMESSYDPFARSYRGASGLWQLMPATASGYGVKHNWWYDGRRDVKDSTTAALNYLSYLGNYFSGDWYLALAAYDAGEGSISRRIEYNASHGHRTSFWHLPLPAETQSYVPRLLALASIIEHPNQYGIQLPTVLNQPYLASVDVKKHIDLRQAARLANMRLAEFEALNPGFSHHKMDPTRTNHFLVPVDRLDDFKIKLASAPEIKISAKEPRMLRHTKSSHKKKSTKKHLVKSHKSKHTNKIEHHKRKKVAKNNIEHHRRHKVA